MMANLQILEADHEAQARDISALRVALSRVPSDLDAARRLISRIDRQLTEHIRWEEQTYYPALALALGGEDDGLFEELMREHVELLVTATALQISLQQEALSGPVRTRALQFCTLFEEHAHREQEAIRRALAGEASSGA